MRNLINQSCDQPVGYPIFVSDIVYAHATATPLPACMRRLLDCCPALPKLRWPRRARPRGNVALRDPKGTELKLVPMTTGASEAPPMAIETSEPDSPSEGAMCPLQETQADASGPGESPPAEATPPSPSPSRGSLAAGGGAEMAPTNGVGPSTPGPPDALHAALDGDIGLWSTACGTFSRSEEYLSIEGEGDGEDGGAPDDDGLV